MDLKDFLPDEPKFTLKSTGDFIHELRLPNFEDRATFAHMLGGEDAYRTVFSKRKWDDICKLAYVLLKDKSKFPATETEDFDHEGIKRKYLVTGPIMLLRAIGPQEEAVKLLGALSAAIVASEPIARPYIENELKKKIAESELTGTNFTTLLPENTATPSESSVS